MSNKLLARTKQKLPIANCQLPVFFTNCQLLVSYNIAYNSPIKKSVLVVWLIVVHIALYAQHTIMQSFNINDGLVSNQVRGFYQDNKGFIWIMTWEGLSRHDGHSFRNYTLAEGLGHPMINAMIEDKEGKIYIAENNGIVDIIDNGEVNQELRRQNPRAINKLIPEPSGRILAPCDEIGVGVFNEGSIDTLNNARASFTVFDVISEGEYFFVCGTTSGVLLHDHTIIEQWTEHIDYNCILKDNLKQIWVGTSNGHRRVNLSATDTHKLKLSVTDYLDMPWSGWIIRDIIQTSDSSIWLAAIGGLIQIKPDHTWRLYNRNDGLPTDYVTTIFEDKAGFLWIGTDQGLAKLDIRNSIDLFTIGEDLPNSLVTDILPAMDGSAFIISNRSSIFKIKPNQPLQPLYPGIETGINEFLVMGFDTLVSTDRGRYILNDNRIKSWTDLPFALSEISLEMKNGCLFSAIFKEITISCPAETHIDSTLNDIVFAISSVKDEEIWIGTVNDGIYQVSIIRNSSGKMELKWRDFSDYIPEKTIRSLHVDEKENVWIGTRYSGLIQLYIDTLTGKYATQIFDRSDGFISDFIKSIASDKDGNIWVGTHAGIEKLIPTSYGYRVFSFSRVHNFFAIVTKLVVGPDQTIWCITASGAARIKDGRYETTPPSGVYITSVSTAKQTLIDPQYRLPFDLKYNQNFLDIEFSSNDHINGRQLKYSYRLNGSQDTAWSKPFPIHKVSFANLLPGNYDFEVRMLGWNGTFGKKTSYKFRINPPFWQQTWFLLLALAAFLAVLYSFYRYRIRQLNQIQEVRNRIASDLHDEIGSSLTHVNILSEIGKKTSEPSDQSQQIFERIGEEVQTSSEALDDIIWSVSTRTDTAEDLISRMRRYASELFEAKGISFSLHETDLDETQSIGLELRRDFYLIYKELLRNILRHAHATEVDISIKGENRFLELVISDNGQGFNPETPTDRQGLHSIRSRVAKWKGHISIDSSPDKGTSIRIGLPLKSGHFLKKA